MSRQEAFIATIAPIAVKLRAEGSTIFPSVRIGLAALETGWTIPSWNSVTGYKVGSGQVNEFWKGAYVNKGTWEVYDGKRTDVRSNFRAYDSVEDSLRDQDVLFSWSNYDRVRQAQTPDEQARMLQACGYATDPAYANKIINILNKHHLRQYDQVQELPKKEDDASATTYTVVSGDTLTSIAGRFQTTVSELVRLNNIGNPDLIRVGQKLAIEATSAISKPTVQVPPPVLRRGNRSSAVGQLQRVLNQHSPRFNPGPVDNSYGPLTQGAVLRYQKYYGVRPYDGIYGPLTHAKLQETANS